MPSLLTGSGKLRAHVVPPSCVRYRPLAEATYHVASSLGSSTIPCAGVGAFTLYQFHKSNWVVACAPCASIEIPPNRRHTPAANELFMRIWRELLRLPEV